MLNKEDSDIGENLPYRELDKSRAKRKPLSLKKAAGAF